MARASRHDVLFEPIRIGPKIFPNRFMQVPHCTGFGSDKPFSQARFRAIKAEGGWGAVSTEACSVHPEADRAPQAIARLWDDDDVANLSVLCDEVHEFGALVGVELFHPGPHIEGSLSREVPGGVSQLPSELYPMTYPREMSRAEIREVRQFFALAAGRARRAGFDIIYTYGAHSYLPMQFLSNYYNQRSDEYGGTLRNRARFWLEVLDAVREAVDGECVVAARLAVKAEDQGAAPLEEALEFVSLADDLVDLWDANVSSIGAMWSDITPSRLYRQGVHAEVITRLREVTSKPLVGVGRLTDPDEMAELIRCGAWDLIGAARPSISDPFLPAKIQDGRYGDIRECIGCNICRTTALGPGNIGCTQNPTAGEEFRRGWHPEQYSPAKNRRRRVLIIGGGVAGLECALVLGKRGFDSIEVRDAALEPGGYASLAASLPGLREWGRLVSWRIEQLSRLENVALEMSTDVAVEDVARSDADIVIVATGASWRTDGVGPMRHVPIPGVQLPHVLAPEKYLQKAPNGSGRAIVYDCEGYFMGVGIAELLAIRGAEVTLVSPYATVAGFLDRTHEGPPTRRRLREMGVQFKTEASIVGISRDSCKVVGPYGAEEMAADEVVLLTARRSHDALYRSLMDSAERNQARGQAVYAIGDCVAPRLFGDCIFDGHRLGREIDSPDPARPLPFKRERGLARYEQLRYGPSNRDDPWGIGEDSECDDSVLT